MDLTVNEKNLIKDNIQLLREHNFDEFIESIKVHVSPKFRIYHIYNYLTEKGIDIVNYLDYVPEYYYYKSKETKFMGHGNIKTLKSKSFRRSNMIQVEVPTVVEAGFDCFRRSFFLKEVSLPRCEKLGEAAFANCTALKKVELPVLKYVPGFAFTGCENLIDIDLSGAIAFGSNAFEGSGLESIESSNIEYIDLDCFGECKQLTKVKFTNPSLKIEEDVFRKCYSLSEVTLPKHLMPQFRSIFHDSNIENIDQVNWV